MTATDQRGTTPASVDRGPLSTARGLLSTARPKQWVKNALVFAAPGAAGVLDERDALVRALIAFAACSLAASGTYLLNDAADADSDRRHPVKRFRPVAAGVVSVPLARATGVVLVVSAVAGAALLGNTGLAVVVSSYLALTTAYTLWLKHVVVADIVAVAAGFVLRAIAGAAATEVPISQWFFIVASFGALFMVSGKRHAEQLDLGDEAGDLRRTLSAYPTSFLTYMRSVSSGAAMMAYCLWSFEKAAEISSRVPWFELSIVPFVFAVMRYAFLLDTGKGGAPEDLILGDRTMVVAAGVWALVFAVGAYAG